MTNLDVDDFLEHFGVNGQKWGVRKGKGTTGISRSRGVLIDRNSRVVSNVKQARSGKKYKRTAAIGKALVGEQKQKENWSRLIKDLNAQNKRVAAGKLTVDDRLAVYGGFSLFDLVVSRQPSA